MGRADIATLSEISFGVRLCLHPSAQRRGRRVMPKFLNAHPSRFLSHHVGRDAPLRVLERALGHLIALFSFALRAQSLRGHNGEVVRIAKKMGDAFASVTSSTCLLRPVKLRRASPTVRTLQ